MQRAHLHDRFIDVPLNLYTGKPRLHQKHTRRSVGLEPSGKIFSSLKRPCTKLEQASKPQDRIIRNTTL